MRFSASSALALFALAAAGCAPVQYCRLSTACNEWRSLGGYEHRSHRHARVEASIGAPLPPDASPSSAAPTHLALDVLAAPMLRLPAHLGFTAGGTLVYGPPAMLAAIARVGVFLASVIDGGRLDVTLEAAPPNYQSPAGGAERSVFGWFAAGLADELAWVPDLHSGLLGTAKLSGRIRFGPTNLQGWAEASTSFGVANIGRNIGDRTEVQRAVGTVHVAVFGGDTTPGAGGLRIGARFAAGYGTWLTGEALVPLSVDGVIGFQPDVAWEIELSGGVTLVAPGIMEELFLPSSVFPHATLVFRWYPRWLI